MKTPVPSRPPRRRRESQEARRLAILAAACDVFLRHGYEAARLDAVAAAAGVAKGTLYLYFPNKAELLKAVIRHHLVPRVEAAGAMADGLEGPAAVILGRLLAGFGATVKNPTLRGLVHLVIAEAPRFPDIADFYRNEMIAVGMAAVRAVVRHGVATGEFRASGLEEFPQILLGPVMIALIWTTLFAERAPLDVDAMIERWLDLMLDGLRAKP